MSVPFHPLADGSICYDPLTRKYGVWRKFKGTNSLVETYHEEAINLGTGNTTDQAAEIGSDVDPVG